MTTRPAPSESWQFQLRRPLRGGVMLLPLIGRNADNRRSLAVWNEYAEFVDAIRQENLGKQPAQMEKLRHARNVFRVAGLDPTRTRPSSESLIRRVLKGEILPQLNPLVDLGNLASLSSGLPVGIYDCQRLSGRQIVFRLGRAGEEYDSIGRGLLSLQGKPLLSDAAGPFGMPISDSARTAVTENTVDFLHIFYAPVDFDRKLFMQEALIAANRFAVHTGAEIDIPGIID